MFTQYLSQITKKYHLQIAYVKLIPEISTMLTQYLMYKPELGDAFKNTFKPFATIKNKKNR